MLDVPYKNVTQLMVPIIDLPHNQYSYVHNLVPYTLNLLEERNTLWVFPGGSLDLILGIYKVRADKLDSLNLHIGEVDEPIYQLYSEVADSAERFIEEHRVGFPNLILNVVAIHALHALLNRSNVHLELCTPRLDKYVAEYASGDNGLVFINTTPRGLGIEFEPDVLLATAFDRLSNGQPTLMGGCNSHKVNKALEGSSVDVEEFYVDRYYGQSKSRALLSIHSYY